VVVAAHKREAVGQRIDRRRRRQVGRGAREDDLAVEDAVEAF
jgi:hypothetical protein